MLISKNFKDAFGHVKIQETVKNSSNVVRQKKRGIHKYIFQSKFENSNLISKQVKIIKNIA